MKELTEEEWECESQRWVGEEQTKVPREDLERIRSLHHILI